MYYQNQEQPEILHGGLEFVVTMDTEISFLDLHGVANNYLVAGGR
jgi:hypothetical protein